MAVFNRPRRWPSASFKSATTGATRAPPLATAAAAGGRAVLASACHDAHGPDRTTAQRETETPNIKDTNADAGLQSRPTRRKDASQPPPSSPRSDRSLQNDQSFMGALLYRGHGRGLHRWLPTIAGRMLQVLARQCLHTSGAHRVHSPTFRLWRAPKVRHLATRGRNWAPKPETAAQMQTHNNKDNYSATSWHRVQRNPAGGGRPTRRPFWQRLPPPPLTGDAHHGQKPARLPSGTEARTSVRGRIFALPPTGANLRYPDPIDTQHTSTDTHTNTDTRLLNTGGRKGSPHQVFAASCQRR